MTRGKRRSLRSPLVVALLLGDSSSLPNLQPVPEPPLHVRTCQGLPPRSHACAASPALPARSLAAHKPNTQPTPAGCAFLQLAAAVPARPLWHPARILVLFKQGHAAAAAAAGGGEPHSAAMQGLQLERLVGEHHARERAASAEKRAAVSSCRQLRPSRQPAAPSVPPTQTSMATAHKLLASLGR
jgi:hypothetical protein